MATEVGAAYVSIVPSTRGFGTTLGRQINKPVGDVGRSSGKRFGGAFALGFKALAGGALVGAGLGAIVKSGVQAEASFSQTMNTLAAATNTPKSGIRTLTTLALDMGAKTVFSAGEAADAMLELAKGGLTVAQIRAGALAQTLTLAAAGGTDLATASTIMANAMNTFGLAAADTPKITAALAGGANASTASIESLGQALGQVGPGALNAGLSVQETVAALSAFDNAGIKGSDAGTSLKNMLARLIPNTAKSAKAMRQLGLDFTDAQGNVLPLVDVAGQLTDALGPLNDAARTRALNTIFGQDASRAASVLASEGVGGIRAYIKATQDLDAAERIAQARMSGTAGVLEQLRGSWETAQLQIGQAMAPLVQRGATALTSALNGVAAGIPTLVKKITDPFGRFQTEILPKLRAFGTYLKNDLGPALVNFAQVVGPALRDSVKSIVGSVRSLIGAFTRGEGSAGGFGQTLVTVLPVAARLAAAGLKILAINVRILTTSFRVLTANINLLATVGVAAVRFFASGILRLFGTVVNAAAKAFGWIPGIGPKLKTAAAKFAVFRARVEASLSGFGALGFQVGSEFSRQLALGIQSGTGASTSAAQGVANKLSAGLKGGRLVDGTRAADVRRAGARQAQVNVTVNNPIPERASESTPKAIRRATHSAGWAAP